MSVRNRRFEDHLGHHHIQGSHIISLMMIIEMVLETSVSYRQLTRLIAREDLVETKKLMY
jgi:hypothetical protein